SQTRCGLRVARKQLEEALELLAVIAKARRKLPQDGPELFAQGQHALREEVCQGLLDIPQLEHVSDVPAALHAEDEVRGRLLVPLLPALRALERIERAVDLDSGELRGGVRKLVLLSEVVGIERAAPRLVSPA